MPDERVVRGWELALGCIGALVVDHELEARGQRVAERDAFLAMAASSSPRAYSAALRAMCASTESASAGADVAQTTAHVVSRHNLARDAIAVHVTRGAGFCT